MSDDLRDLTKSLIRLPWAMAAFGVSRAADLLTPKSGLRTAAEAMDGVSHAAERSLGGIADDLYRAGDHLQSGVVDAAWDLASGSWTRPDESVKKAWRTLDRSWSQAMEVAERRR